MSANGSFWSEFGVSASAPTAMLTNARQAPLTMSTSPADHIQESKIDRIHEPGCGGSKYWPSMTAKSNIPPLKNMSSPISRTDSHDIYRLGDIKLQWEKIDYHKSCAFI